MIKSCKVLTVSFHGHPVSCSCLDLDEPGVSGAAGSSLKLSLAARLLEHMRSGLGGEPRVSRGNSTDLALRSDRLGRPLLLIDGKEGPSVSFSRGRGAVWAALCPDPFTAGIDVAGVDEFHGGYPLRRAFHDKELRMAADLGAGPHDVGAAFLWSAKEAVVKALGCGFHWIDPLEVIIDEIWPEARGYRVRPLLCLPASKRNRLAGRIRAVPLAAYAWSLENVWVSVALAAADEVASTGEPGPGIRERIFHHSGNNVPTFNSLGR